MVLLALESPALGKLLARLPGAYAAGVSDIAQVHSRIDELFERGAAVFGRDLAPYRGHAHRVAELAARQVEMREQWVEPLAVAGYFHDAGIWFDGTWDYLPGSERRAAAEDPADAQLVTAMISEHHRIRHARDPHPLVEALRRADAADIYRVGFPPGTTRADYRQMLRRWPDAHFHAMLARGFWMGVKEGKPASMVKL